MQGNIPDDPSVIKDIFDELKQSYKTGKTRDLKFRKKALQNLIQAYEKSKPEFQEALKKDLGYNQFMSNFVGHHVTLAQVKVLLQGIDQWVKPQKVSTPIGLGLASSQIQFQPLGLILVLSAWNYPLYTAIPQVAAAMAAGNTVILKPSEGAPHTSNAIKRMFEKYIDKSYFRVIQGQVQVGKALTKLPFDGICFTGSSTIGRLVAIQAAKNLTPCILQCGGKCPVIVDQSAKIDCAVTRILFGRFLNCGQTCVAGDHVYVHQSIYQTFKKVLIAQAQHMFYNGQNLVDEGNYGKIINQYHLNRIQKMLKQNHNGKILIGGQINKDKRYFSPTIVEKPKMDSSLMKQQIFGPILPLQTYTSLDTLIDSINDQPKPLAIYLFSQNSKNITKVKNMTNSGSFVVNQVAVHLLNTQLPFGGVGNSGYGRWGGKSGFQGLSNRKSILYSQALNVFPMTEKYPPYTPGKQKIMTKLLKISHITLGQVGRTLFILLLLGVLGGATYKYYPRL